jgi:hypothetical protein
MFGNGDTGDVENVKDHNGTGSSGVDTKRRDEVTRTGVIVRTGHPALDAAIAADRSAQPDLRVLQAGCRRSAADVGDLREGPATAAGAIVDRMSLTQDRDGAGETLHAGSTHRVVDAKGRSRTIRVWHEMATHGCN